LYYQTKSETDGDDRAGIPEKLAWREPPSGIGKRGLVMTSTLLDVSHDSEVFHLSLLTAGARHIGVGGAQKYRTVVLTIHAVRLVHA
jgi:hypothetical protein